MFLLVLLPHYVSAALVINEVAWMGSDVSANDEWIELYNDGTSSVGVDGWVLTDGMNLDIELIGTVSPGQYVVLERTDDSSVVGSAFLIYTGALTNIGATLTLLRSDGSIEDQVSGGENWENIGGDNETKETAQYTNSGWVTVVATPGKENSYVSNTEDGLDDESQDKDENNTVKTITSKSKSKSKSQSEKLKLVLPDITLALTLTAPSVAYVHQPVQFSLDDHGIGDTLINSAQYYWNLGDLTQKGGRIVTHQYEYPGTYVIVVEGGYKRQSASIRHTITVLPVTFSITKNSDGDVQINNDSKYEVDMSGYSVRGDQIVTFPKNTILLPNATLTISKESLGATNYVWLFDQTKMIVASTLPTPALATTEVGNVTVAQSASPIAPPIIVTQTLPVSVSDDENFIFEPVNGENVVEESEVIVAELPKTTENISNVASVNESQIPIPKDKLPYVGLIAVLSLGILAVYASRIK